MAESKVRIVGSGFTSFTFQGKTIAWAKAIDDQAPQAVAQPQAIQPLDAETPVEIALPRAISYGVLRVTAFELWESAVWQSLPGFEGTQNLLDLFKRQVRQGSITCTKTIRLPNGGLRTKVYSGCVITNVNDSEQVAIEAMSTTKDMTIWYTSAKWL